MNNDSLKEFKAYLWRRWILDVLIRTIKTGAETAAGMLTVGALWSSIDWRSVLSVTGVAMIYTVLVNVYKIAADLDEANKMKKPDNVENSGENVEK